MPANQQDANFEAEACLRRLLRQKKHSFAEKEKIKQSLRSFLLTAVVRQNTDLALNIIPHWQKLDIPPKDVQLMVLASADHEDLTMFKALVPQPSARHTMEKIFGGAVRKGKISLLEASVDFISPEKSRLSYWWTGAGQDMDILVFLCKHFNPKDLKSKALHQAIVFDNIRAVEVLYPLSESIFVRRNIEKKNPRLCESKAFGRLADLCDIDAALKLKNKINKKIAPEVKAKDAGAKQDKEKKRRL